MCDENRNKIWIIQMECSDDGEELREACGNLRFMWKEGVNVFASVWM